MAGGSHPTRVCDLMSHRVIQVSEEDTVEFVINLFHCCQISGAPVVNGNGEYVGVISRTDLSGKRVLDWVDQDCHFDALLIREVMNPGDPVTVRENAPVADAVRVMLENRIHRVFAANPEGRIIGILSSFDVLKAVHLPPGDQGPTEAPAALTPASLDETAAKAAAAPQTPKNESPEPEKEPAKDPEKPNKNEAEGKTELEERIQNLIRRKQQEITLQ